MPSTPQPKIEWFEDGKTTTCRVSILDLDDSFLLETSKVKVFSEPDDKTSVTLLSTESGKDAKFVFTFDNVVQRYDTEGMSYIVCNQHPDVNAKLVCVLSSHTVRLFECSGNFMLIFRQKEEN